MEIREMLKSDWNEVSRIYQDGINTNLATFEGEIPDYQSFDKKHFKECRYVLLDNHKIVAWALLQPISNRKVYSGVAEVSIYVDMKSQGKGYGSYLLHYLIQKSEEHGFYMLQSGIMSNNLKSRKLHQKCGFRLVGEREKIAKDQNGNYRSMVIMERRSQLEKYL